MWGFAACDLQGRSFLNTSIGGVKLGAVKTFQLNEGDSGDDEENSCFAFRNLLPGSNGIFTNTQTLAGAKAKAAG